MDYPPVEHLRVLSARRLHELTGLSEKAIGRELPSIPQAYRTDGGHWRCPLWAWYRHQEARGT